MPLLLPTNIRLGWKGLPGTNTLAFYNAAAITAFKKFYSTSSWCLHYKTFYGRNLRIFPDKPFQSSLMFAGKTEPTQVKHLSNAPLQGSLLASPQNIRLDWKGLPGTNTIAFYENP
jgi:hypothetical protein